MLRYDPAEGTVRMSTGGRYRYRTVLRRLNRALELLEAPFRVYPVTKGSPVWIVRHLNGEWEIEFIDRMVLSVAHPLEGVL